MLPAAEEKFTTEPPPLFHDSDLLTDLLFEVDDFAVDTDILSFADIFLAWLGLVCLECTLFSGATFFMLFREEKENDLPIDLLLDVTDFVVAADASSAIESFFFRLFREDNDNDL